MTIIESLWYGDIAMNERKIENDEEYNKIRLPYIEVESSDRMYNTYLVIVPGEFLYTIYSKHNNITNVCAVLLNLSIYDPVFI